MASRADSRLGNGFFATARRTSSCFAVWSHRGWALALFSREMTQQHVLSEEEYRMLRDAAAVDPEMLVAYLLGADAGLRRGEILGLSWEDVETRASKLVVRQGDVAEGRQGARRTDDPRAARCAGGDP